MAMGVFLMVLLECDEALIPNFGHPSDPVCEGEDELNSASFRKSQHALMFNLQVLL